MATEKRLIDANELMEQIRYYDKREQNELWETPDIEYVVAEQPTVDAVEVVHGRWIMDKLEIGNPYDGNSKMLVDIGNCSVCGHRCEMLPIMNYCPNCGAKMDGDGNERC